MRGFLSFTRGSRLGSWGYRRKDDSGIRCYWWRYGRRYWVWLTLALLVIPISFLRYSAFILPIFVCSLSSFSPGLLGIVSGVSVTQVVRKLSRRTKGKSCSGSLSEMGVEKRADGCQSVVEVEESCSFATILHVLRDFLQKIRTNRAGTAEEVLTKLPR